MTLQFVTELNNKPNYFVEKILNSLHYKLRLGAELNSYLKFKKFKYSKRNDFIDKIIKVNPKIHTIREDKTNRWEVGNKIHFKIWTGKAYRSEQFQFAPIVKVILIQEIEINIVANVETPYTYKYNGKNYQICVDGNCLIRAKMLKLAINDGFENLDDFFDYFKTEFTGKIIHWTSFSY